MFFWIQIIFYSTSRILLFLEWDNHENWRSLSRSFNFYSHYTLINIQNALSVPNFNNLLINKFYNLSGNNQSSVTLYNVTLVNQTIDSNTTNTINYSSNLTLNGITIYNPVFYVSGGIISCTFSSSKTDISMF